MPATITKAQPAISTTPSAGGPVGTFISYGAPLAVHSFPTRRSSDLLYGPGDTACSGTVVYTDTKPLVGGSASSGSYPTTAPGTYHWTATYNGDSNNFRVRNSSRHNSSKITKA